MVESVRLAIMLEPLAIYLYILGIWQSGLRPKIVSGKLDHALLVFGLSGIVIVGPLGEFLLERLFGPANPVVWILWIGFALLWAIFLEGRAGRRFVVYKVDSRVLLEAIRICLAAESGRFVETIQGFEDREGGITVTIHPHQTLRSGSVQVEGPDADTFRLRLQCALAAHFGSRPAEGHSHVAWGLFAVAWVALVMPMLNLLLHDPRIRTLVREVRRHLFGA
ncbi:MAG: hypothetical protein SFX72_02380 [Isosphaeraceae bacterium]|nr:hypothetical protein [Isosphaeraceae bacterium]